MARVKGVETPPLPVPAVLLDATTTPDVVDVPARSAVAIDAVGKKGGKLEGSEEASRVFLERIPAARVGRILHVGPARTSRSTCPTRGGRSPRS